MGQLADRLNEQLRRNIYLESNTNSMYKCAECMGEGNDPDLIDHASDCSVDLMHEVFLELEYFQWKAKKSFDRSIMVDASFKVDVSEEDGGVQEFDAGEVFWCGVCDSKIANAPENIEHAEYCPVNLLEELLELYLRCEGNMKWPM